MMLSTTQSKVLERFVDEHIASRIWNGDETVWRDIPKVLTGWMDMPHSLSSRIRETVKFTESAKLKGFTDAVIVGMGGSIGTAQIVKSVSEKAERGLRFHTIDTVHPATVRKLEECINTASSLFVIISKSGNTLETLTLEKHFRALCRARGGGRKHFIYITDKDTPIDKRRDDFDEGFISDSKTGGRYSSLSYEGVLPASLAGIWHTSGDVRICKNATPAIAMMDACRQDRIENPGIRLAAVLADAAASARDKLIITLPRGHEKFGLWLEQIIAESLGKEGRGLIPIITHKSDGGRIHREDCTYIDLTSTDYSGGLFPTSLYKFEDICAAFFLWQFAVSAAAHSIGVNPFDQPDVEAAKKYGVENLEGKMNRTPESRLPLREAVKTALYGLCERGYIALVSWLPEEYQINYAINGLKAAITNIYGIPVVTGYGPRYLHSTGQLFKGGPDTVRMVAIRMTDSPDLLANGTPYTFRQIMNAMADGDLAAMRNKGRFVIEADVKKDPAKVIADTTAEIIGRV